jgi:type I restriction-modification system DNA methylase subunit
MLNSLYEILDFESGTLLPAIEEPTASIKSNDWLEKGEWLSAAKRAGAEKIFFVENNPVAVFAKCGADHIEKAKAFNHIWSLARPRLLFLASPNEISVIDLAQKPLDISKIKQSDHPLDSEFKTLVTIKSIGEITQLLQEYHRDNIESGKVFGDSQFGDLKNRADKALIRDLKTVRRELIQAGLSKHLIKYAHALIGRSIFIRYLEDRDILTLDYFQGIARQTTGWTEFLRNQSSRAGFDFSECKALYPRVLQNKEFTYALFRKLAKDFNGDMFPEVELDDEEKAVKQKHLNLIQGLLYGDAGVQNKLFFYSYLFDIIPLDLISSIYEEFYHSSIDDDEKKSKARQDGAYYTPPVLAEFVLSQTLTSKELKKKPRVLDPACGSGIFLVEAFRRMVRYEWHKQKVQPSFEFLKQTLQDQIAGIEINEEAARITAFSLYLAMLHYLDPPSIKAQINQGNKLPNLLVTTESKSSNHIHCIWVDDAFDEARIEASPLLKKRFGKDSVDIVVGNPPWGAPGNKADEKTKAREKVMLEWCRINKKPIGNKEHSQAFLWRAIDFLKEGGKAGMLVSAGVLFKHSGTTKAFREQWMNYVRLMEVFNFTHVRSFFFKGAISPFLALTFAKERQNDQPVKYYSAKQVTTVKETQSVLFSKYDLHTLQDENLASNELWKSYWFGRFADRKLIGYLHKYAPLANLIDLDKSGRGYQTYEQKHDGIELGVDKTIIDIPDRYNSVELVKLPSKIYNVGPTECYKGKRLLISEGIKEKASIQEQKGVIVARFEDELQYSFYRSVYGIKILSDEDDVYKLILGILWSSLARYYFFMTSANWGLWNHKLLLDEILQLPIPDKRHPSVKKIITLVNKLRSYHPKEKNLISSSGVPEDEIKAQRSMWEAELDDAVFAFYSLNEEQKDLIRDCCEVTLPFFYKPFDSIGAMPAVQNNELSWIKLYVHIFARRWNAYLENDIEMRAEIHVGAHGNMVAIEFFPADKIDPWRLNPQNKSWNNLLDQIGNSLPQPMGVSQILIDGVVHVVSSDSIIIIKRNEKRFWTRSLAREDAEATLCKRMVDFKPNDGGRD